MSQINVILQRLGIHNSVADQNEVHDTLHEIFISLSPIDLRSPQNRHAVREDIRSQMHKIPNLIESSETALDGVVDILYELFGRLKFRWSRQLAQQQQPGQGVPVTRRWRPGILTGWSQITTRSRASRYPQHVSSRPASTTSGTRQTEMPPIVDAAELPTTASQPTPQEARQNTDEAQSQPRVDDELCESTSDAWVPQERFRPPEIRETLKRKRFTQGISQLTESMELTGEVVPPPPKCPRPSIQAELKARRSALLKRERIQRFSERQRRGSEIKSSSTSGSSKKASSGSKSSASGDKPAAEQSPRFRTEIDWMRSDLEKKPTSQRTASICLSPKTRPRPSHCY